MGFADKLRLMSVLMDDFKTIKEVTAAIWVSQRLPVILSTTSTIAESRPT